SRRNSSQQDAPSIIGNRNAGRPKRKNRTSANQAPTGPIRLWTSEELPVDENPGSSALYVASAVNMTSATTPSAIMALSRNPRATADVNLNEWRACAEDSANPLELHLAKIGTATIIVLMVLTGLIP